MSLSLQEVTRSLPIPKFNKLCQKVDKYDGTGTRFDILGITKVGDKRTVRVLTEKNKTYTIEV